MKTTLGLTKYEIWDKAKNLIFRKMDSRSVTPERADEILGYVQKTIVDHDDSESLRAYLDEITGRFPELSEIEVEIKEADEKEMEEKITGIIEKLISMEQIEVAEKLIEASSDKDKKKLVHIIDKYKNLL